MHRILFFVTLTFLILVSTAYQLTGASSPPAAAIFRQSTGSNRTAEPPKVILERLSMMNWSRNVAGEAQRAARPGLIPKDRFHLQRQGDEPGRLKGIEVIIAHHNEQLSPIWQHGAEG
jgi:hypothetical protein